MTFSAGAGSWGLNGSPGTAPPRGFLRMPGFSKKARSSVRNAYSWAARLAAAALLVGACGAAAPARAALSESGGTGVFEVPSAESKRAARLELGFFGSYARLGLRDPLSTQLNALRGGANLAFGMPGGFEVGGTLPVYGYYNTLGVGASPLDEDLSVRLGDVSGRLRWTGPLLVPGLRWGWEGEVTFATGDDEAVAEPGRGPVKPFTAGQNIYTGRLMTTWDGLRSGAGVPLRLHASGAYHFVEDDRFLLPRAPLPLELPAPAGERDNNVLSLGAAVEMEFPRFTLFTEVVTDQFVHERGLLKGKENRVALNPGVRFWLPGGVSIGGVWSIPLAEDDATTAFDPGRAFPDPEWRVAVSLGTVYRGARDRGATAVAPAASTPAPAVAPLGPVVPRPAAEVAAVPGAEMAPAPVPAPDSATVAREKQKQAILERREIQEDTLVVTPKAKPAPAPVAPEAAAPAPEAAPAVTAGPAAAPAAPVPGAVRAPQARVLDSDGDGIPDDRDQCRLVAEDWDGFQDLDGCPDLDNDQDGIPDVRDGCPNDPETYNGYYDHDGCPDAVSPRWIGPAPGAPPQVPAGTPEAMMATPPAGAPHAATEDTARGPAGAAVPGPARALAAGPAVGAAPGPAAPPARGAAPGPAPRETAARASDSLRAALDVQQRRVGDLEARLARIESARLEAQAAPVTARAATERPAAAPAAPVSPPSPVAAEPPRDAPAAVTAAPAPSATRAGETAALQAERERTAALEARIRDLELRQQMLADRSGRPLPSGTAGTTVVTPPRTSSDADLTARLAVLESEVRRLREGAGAPAPAAAPSGPAPAAAPAGPAPAAAPPGAGPVDSAAMRAEREEVLRQIEAVQAGIDSLRAARPVEAAVIPAEQDVDAGRALDLVLPRGASRVFPEIRFASGSDRPAPEAATALETIASALARVPEARVTVVGHTDNTGSATANRRLSRDRARAVANALIALGADPGQVAIEGRGEQEPVASNATEEGRRLNRRIEFIRTR